MWGQYQALVDGPQGKLVEGLAYEIQTRADADRLAYYETNAYKIVPCRMLVNSGNPVEDLGGVSDATSLYAGDSQALRAKRWGSQTMDEWHAEYAFTIWGDTSMSYLATRCRFSNEYD